MVGLCAQLEVSRHLAKNERFGRRGRAGPEPNAYWVSFNMVMLLAMVWKTRWISAGVASK